MKHDRSMSRRCNTADLRGAPPSDAFRVPMEWRDAALLLSDGSRHAVRLSMGIDASMQDVLEAREPFVPVMEAEVFRLYARSALACVTVSDKPDDELEGSMPLTSRAVRVRLSCGATLEGRLLFVAVHGRARITDVLNEPTSSFSLRHAEGISFVAKAHVISVEEHS